MDGGGVHGIALEETCLRSPDGRHHRGDGPRCLLCRKVLP